MRERGLLGIETLAREEIQQILDRAKFYPAAPGSYRQETGYAARQDHHSPVLRILHTHPDLV